MAKFQTTCTTWHSKKNGNWQSVTLGPMSFAFTWQVTSKYVNTNSVLLIGRLGKYKQEKVLEKRNISFRILNKRRGEIEVSLISTFDLPKLTDLNKLLFIGCPTNRDEFQLDLLSGIDMHDVLHKEKYKPIIAFADNIGSSYVYAFDEGRSSTILTKESSPASDLLRSKLSEQYKEAGNSKPLSLTKIQVEKLLYEFSADYPIDDDSSCHDYPSNDNCPIVSGYGITVEENKTVVPVWSDGKYESNDALCCNVVFDGDIMSVVELPRQKPPKYISFDPMDAGLSIWGCLFSIISLPIFLPIIIVTSIVSGIQMFATYLSKKISK